MIRNLCPCVVGALLSIVEGVDHPGALQHHAYDTGHKHKIGICVSHQVLLRHGREKVVCQPCHSLDGLGIIHTGFLVVIRDELAAPAIDQVVPAVLAVVGVHRCAVYAVILAGFSDLGSRCCVVIPCPVVVGILNAVLVKNLLVVDHRDRVVILGQCVLVAIQVVDVYDAFIVIVEVDRVILCDIIVQIQEHVCSHILLCFVDVHPEYVGHLAAGSACFQKCPVLNPCDDVHLYLDAGLCRPLICDLAKAFELVVVPDVDDKCLAGAVCGCLCRCFRLSLFCCCAALCRCAGSGAGAAASCEGNGHRCCQKKCNKSFHVLPPFICNSVCFVVIMVASLSFFYDSTPFSIHGQMFFKSRFRHA